MNDQIKTQLSAFVDGELSDAESELLIRRISRDPALREQVAEYQAIGRVIRGEYSVRLDGLLDSIKSEIDSPAAVTEPEREQSRFVRPLAGIATAAAVALVSIIAVGQFAPATDSVITTDQYTVPSSDMPTDDMREYYLRHGESANGFNTRVVSLQLREETLEESSATEDEDKTETELTTE